jgi:hypothetical protein
MSHLKKKSLSVRFIPASSQMEEVKKVVEEKVETVVEQAVSAEKVDAVVDKVEDAVEKAAEALGDKVEEVLEKNPVLEKVVHIIDEKLAARGCSVSFWGWEVSLRKVRQSPLPVPAKSEASPSTETK